MDVRANGARALVLLGLAVLVIPTASADPLTVVAVYDEAADAVQIVASSRFLDGSARLDAEDEIFYDVLTAAGVLLADDQAVIESPEQDGAYLATYADPPNGVLAIVVHTLDPVSGEPIGASTLVQVSNATVADLNATLAAFFGDFDSHTEGDWWTMDFDGMPATDLALAVAFTLALAGAMLWKRFITALLASLALLGTVVDPWPFPAPWAFLALLVGLWVDQFVDPARVQEFFSSRVRGRAGKNRKDN